MTKLGEELKELKSFHNGDYHNGEYYYGADEVIKETLDKIKVEIEKAYCKVENYYDQGRNYGLYMATQIIDKYMKGK